MIWANGSVINYGHGLFRLMIKYNTGHFTFPTIIGKNHFLKLYTNITYWGRHRPFHWCVWWLNIRMLSPRPGRVHAALHRLHHVRPRLHLHHHRDRQVIGGQGCVMCFTSLRQESGQLRNIPDNDWVNTINCQHSLWRNLIFGINKKIIRYFQ